MEEYELYKLPRDRKIYVFCQIGEFSKQVVELLKDADYAAYNLTGGYGKYLKEFFHDDLRPGLLKNG